MATDSTGTIRPFSIKIFLADGSPSGLRIVEKTNWIGRGVVIPRPRFGIARKRAEFEKAGVYVLQGHSSETGRERIYVGEGDPVRPRLDAHVAQKDFWTHAYIFTSEGQNLNKAHVQYLEARLVELAAAAKRCELENGNKPQRPSLSEADEAEVEGFLAEMLLCLPVLGVVAFEQPELPGMPAARLGLRGRGVEATGYEADEGFVVVAGSQVARDTVPSIHEYLAVLRRELLDRGVIVPRADGLVFAQDYVFNSPSTGAGVVLGRSANGRVEWKTPEGKTLKELQEAPIGGEARADE